MRTFNFRSLGATVATLCIGLMTALPSLHAGLFHPTAPVQINPTTDYLYPIRDAYYTSLFTGSNKTDGISLYVEGAVFNPENEVFFYSWTPGTIIVNPKNSNHLVTLIGHDTASFSAPPNPFFPAIDIQVANSVDGGKTWKTVTIDLSPWQAPKGKLSQTTTAIDIAFAPNGVLYLLGTGTDTVTNTSLTDIHYWTSYLALPQFGNLQISPLIPGTPSFFADNFPNVHVFRNGPPIDPNTKVPDQTNHPGNPASTLFVIKSKDGGKTWGEPVIVDATQTGAFEFLAQGISTGLESTLFVTKDSTSIVGSSRVENLNTLFSYVYTARSTDDGRTWTTQNNSTSIKESTPVYTLYNDANFQASVAIDPNYFASFPNAGEPTIDSIVETSAGLLATLYRIYLILSNYSLMIAQILLSMIKLSFIQRIME